MVLLILIAAPAPLLTPLQQTAKGFSRGGGVEQLNPPTLTMSIDIDWSKLIEDQVLETQLRDFLDDQFCRLQLPPFIQSLRVSSLKLGTKSPELTIRHISDPFPEFYQEDPDFESDDHLETQNDQDIPGPIDPNASIPEVYVDPSPAITRLNEAMVDRSSLPELNEDVSPFDFQAIVELGYQGDMELGVTATLLVNYPSPNFISLPLSFQVSGIDIHSLAVVAVIPNRISISVLCDVDSNDQMSSDSVKVIKAMKIQSKIGDSSHNGAVLRNVGRVEKFILEQLRKVIRDELVWPGWITLEV